MKKMIFSEVRNNVINFNGGEQTRLGMYLVCVYSIKPNRVRKSGRHIIGHAAKCVMVSNARYPKYESKVASVLGMSITPQPLNGMRWIDYPYIKQSLKDGLRYLSIYYALSDSQLQFDEKWLWDGKEATPQQIAEIEMAMYGDNRGAVSAKTYQIDEVYEWDGVYYMGKEKEKAKEVWNEIGG